MKVGYFSPLPPARTGVADYASALLHALRRVSTVEVNASRPDVNLYHVGNNQLQWADLLLLLGALAHNGSLVDLHLADTPGLMANAPQDGFSGLAGFKGLEQLDLTGCGLVAPGLGSLVAASPTLLEMLRHRPGLVGLQLADEMPDQVVGGGVDSY